MYCVAIDVPLVSWDDDDGSLATWGSRAAASLVSVSAVSTKTAA